MAPFTADEAWSFHHSGKDITADFLALQAWPKVTAEWDEGKELSDAQTILDFKDLKVNDSLESLRTRKEIGQSLEAEIEIRIPLSESLLTLLRHREEDLAEMFIVSNVLIVEVSEDEELQVISRHASGQRCPRSWRWVPKLVSIEPWGEVSPRCAEVLAKLV
jgi:isoleucyl-tRNA synthetase